MNMGNNILHKSRFQTLCTKTKLTDTMVFRLKTRKVTLFSEHTPPHFYFLHLPNKSVLSASIPIRLHQIQSKIPNRMLLLQFHLLCLEFILMQLSKCEQSN